MLKLDESFFKEEVRCGFTIPSMMKRAWAVEMDVLTEIDRICKEYGLIYYAAYGTMLGAVRHQGFIPWDDDIDIFMKRTDYQRLMSILPDELPEGFYNSSSYSDSKHMQPLSSVMNTESIITDESKKEKFYGCPYICGVDIFPLDYIPDDINEFELFRNMCMIVYTVAKDYNVYNEEEREEYIKQVENLCKIHIVRNGSEQNQLWLLFDKVAGMYKETECKELTYLPTNICYNKDYKFEKEWFSDVKIMPFENIDIPVPVGFDEILEFVYGDYMTPNYTHGRAHEYPFYKKQEEFLRKTGLL